MLTALPTIRRPTSRPILVIAEVPRLPRYLQELDTLEVRSYDEISIGHTSAKELRFSLNDILCALLSPLCVTYRILLLTHTHTLSHTRMRARMDDNHLCITTNTETCSWAAQREMAAGQSVASRAGRFADVQSRIVRSGRHLQHPPAVRSVSCWKPFPLARPCVVHVFVCGSRIACEISLSECPLLGGRHVACRSLVELLAPDPNFRGSVERRLPLLWKVRAVIESRTSYG